MVRHDPTSVAVRSITVDRSGYRVLHNLSLTIPDQARTALIGPNGVGKSTLLAVIAGRLEPTSGTVVRHPPDARVGLLDQELKRSTTTTGRALVAERVGVAGARADFEAATAALADGGPQADEQYNRALIGWEQAGGFDFDHRLDAIGLSLGLDPDILDRPTATLSGGQLTKVGLASIMVSHFDVTLLDEPTNNLDDHGLDLLETWVLSHDRPLVVVSHDRNFLERTVTSVAKMVADGFDPAKGNLEVFTGTWAQYEEQVAQARRQAKDRYEAYSAERHRLQTMAQQKREWADRGSSRARKKPADNDRYRYQHNLVGAEKQIGAAKAVAKRLERLEAAEGGNAAKPWQPWELQFSIAETDRGSAEALVASEVVLCRGSFVLGPLSLVVGWAERVLLDGPNGSGKTTLLDGLVGRLLPESGSVVIGPATTVGEIGQLRTAFVDHVDDKEGVERTLLEVFADQSGLDYTESRSLMAKFGLAAAVKRPASSLSPGQRTRAELALFQARGVNLIVLDEPTNHLDMEAIEQLEQALETFSGTLLIISHDHRFRAAINITRTISVPNANN